MTVSNYTEEREWSQGLSGCKSLPTLRAFVAGWMPYVPDALAIVESMSEHTFERWRGGLAIERKGNFAGEDFAREFGQLIIPDKLLAASLLASSHHVPLGLALIRLAEISPPNPAAGSTKEGADK